MNFQEDSICLGLAFIISAVSLFDEYVNELLYLRVGSCFPRYIMECHSLKLYINDCNILMLIMRYPVAARPLYRRNKCSCPEKKKCGDNDKKDLENGREGPYTSKLISQQSRTWKQAIHRYKPVQVRTKTPYINIVQSAHVTYYK